MDAMNKIDARVKELEAKAEARGYARALDEVHAKLGVKPVKAKPRTTVLKKPGAKTAKTAKKFTGGRKPGKSTMVREIITRALAQKESVTRDEILKAAQHLNPKVTSYDVGNATSVLARNKAIKTSYDQPGMIFRPSEANSAAATH